MTGSGINTLFKFPWCQLRAALDKLKYNFKCLPTDAQSLAAYIIFWAYTPQECAELSGAPMVHTQASPHCTLFTL